MTEVQYRELFGIPIYRFKFDKHDELKNSFIEYFDKRENFEHSTTDVDRAKTLFSHPNVHKEILFYPFVNFIKNSLSFAFEDMGYEPSFEITSMWGIKQKINGSHHRHSHNNSFLSGVYYLNGNESTKGTTFFTPYREHTILRPRKINNSTLKPGMRKNISFNEGNLVIFPSWLEHESAINDSGSNRYIMSFNCMPVGITNWSYYDRYNYQSISNAELIEDRNEVTRNGR